MGKRQDIFTDIIHGLYTAYKHQQPTDNAYKQSAYWDVITSVYYQLSGNTMEPPLKFGKWDIPTKDFIVELDEERHFNRYRLKILESSFYELDQNFSVENYSNYCEKFELECLRCARWGNYWKTDRTEKIFGLSNGDGDLSMGGSSRWKQRAYNDFLRDVASKIIGIPVIRISIYDRFENETINQLLKHHKRGELLKFLQQRIAIEK